MEMKSIFFVSLPKSGTVYTWNAICDVTGLKMPSFHTLDGWQLYNSGRDFSCPQLYACGDYNTQLLRPDEMKHYMQGYFFGAHMQASYHNISVLEESGIDRIVVLLRDPRDAFVSWVYHLRNLGASARNYHSKIYHIPRDYYHWSLERQFGFQIRSFLPVVINWVEGWLDYYASPDRNIDVLFVFYDELKRTRLNYVKKIVHFNEIKSANYLKIPIPVKGKLHFRNGEHRQWKTEFSSEDQLLAENYLQDRIIDGFESAARSHHGFIQSKNHLSSGNNLAAAASAFESIKQFTNSNECYNLFFQATNAAGVNVTEEKNKVMTELNSLTTGDYFIYREHLVQNCRQLLRQLYDVTNKENIAVTQYDSIVSDDIEGIHPSEV